MNWIKMMLTPKTITKLKTTVGIRSEYISEEKRILDVDKNERIKNTAKKGIQSFYSIDDFEWIETK